jgi:2-keto-4-pentenoate hydratase/2-oxohepta-3-ene-1,7-dioic acid hydratase in catechol pathway
VNSPAGPLHFDDLTRAHESVEHLFGVVLVNDWSARALQSWE